MPPLSNEIKDTILQILTDSIIGIVCVIALVLYMYIVIFWLGFFVA